jgi:hypothetical protein
MDYDPLYLEAIEQGRRIEGHLARSTKRLLRASRPKGTAFSEA